MAELYLKVRSKASPTQSPARGRILPHAWIHLPRWKMCGLKGEAAPRELIARTGLRSLLTITSFISGAAGRYLKRPSNLRRLIDMIDEEEWSSLDVDVKGAAFEGLLEKAASEGKKGAGQYFTPRPLIQSICRVMKPDPRGKQNFTIDDPACGTGGFLVASYEWLVNASKGVFDRSEARRIRTATYYGQDLVARPRRLAIMNLYLHGVEPHIYLGDTVYEPACRLILYWPKGF